MARQHGAISLQGTIGNITFVKTRDGFGARLKNASNASRIATHPNYSRTRENLAEFGTAGKSANLVRHAFGSLMRLAKDGRVYPRMVKVVMQGIKADLVSLRGQRSLVQGSPSMLEGFDCNANARLTATIAAPYDALIQRNSGTASITFSNIIPDLGITMPAGATHFRLVSGAAVIDFGLGTWHTDVKESAYFPLTNTPTGLLDLSCQLPPALTAPIFLVLGIQFFQEVNHAKYILNNGAFNALSIVKVDV